MQITTNVDLDTRFIEEGLSVLARYFYDTDPITHIRYVSVYTDDGKGNGDLILEFPCE